MVFPLIPVVAVISAVGAGGGMLWAGKEFGEETGKKTGTILIVAVIGIFAFMILKKGGKI